ncbi:MAG: amidohydrolase [Mycobacterium sp.]|jgi:predicted TIM-barrel fold metal-dependent hydrolase|nr:amidohydrolase [Mycobacterium sp.]
MDLPWVISVDDHVVEPPTVWLDRLPSSMRSRGPHIVQDRCQTIIEAGSHRAQYVKGGEGPIVDWWVYEDLLRPIPQVVACAGFPLESLTLEPLPYSEMRPGCYDRDARLADMDVNRTERSMCFPTFPRFCGQTFLEAKDKELALASVRAYNDWMIEEWCGPAGGRLIPLCLVPLWDAQLAAAEVRRNAARGCHAVAFTELPVNLGLPSLHDPERYWDPFLAACDETRTTINMHIGSGSKMPTSGPDSPAGVGIALTSLNAYISMADWLLSGVMARFPNIKIAFSESQVGWMPFLIERLDSVFTKSGAWADLDPALTDVPSSYVPGRVYGCFFDDMVGVDLRHQIGIGQLVFETDYPHQDTTWPNTVDVVAAIAQRVTPVELEMLVRTNAIEMLALSPRDLRPAGALTT